MRIRSTAVRLFAGALLLCGTALPAAAHGFGQRYELPLPLTFYLWGAVATVVFSFLVVGLFVRRPQRLDTGTRVDLLAHPVGRLLARLALPLKLVMLVLFLAVLLGGFFGNQDPYRNLAPTLVWIVGWVGLAYVSALIGDVWVTINPWRALYDEADALWGRITGRPLTLGWRYPHALGVWPAVLLLLAFSWIELVYPTPAVPSHIAILALAYSALTWLGMFLFGRDAWLRHGEVFSVVFSTFAQLAPTEIKVGERASWMLRPFGAGLSGEIASPSMTAFVLLLLSSVLYDGLLTTPEWATFESVLIAPFASLGETGAMFVRTLCLVAFWLLFLGAYRAVCIVMSWAVGGSRFPAEIAHAFVFTLIPIAVGYHVAHYLLFLLVQGQYVIPLLSDPFGWGWNLIGTSGYRPDITIVGARFAWYTTVGAVLLGHVVAVYLAHVRAMQLFNARAAVLRSQVPLTTLMVIYTFVSLSILAEPIVQQREAALPSATPTVEVAIPADAVLPASGTGQLETLGPGKQARQKLTYRILGSTFHDGTRTTSADLLYSYSFAYRWGVGSTGDAHYDPAVDAATASIRRNVLGLRTLALDTASRSFRVGDVNFVREVLGIEVYSAVALADPDQDATVQAPWSTLPWHLVALMEEAVSRGWAAFSEAEAARRGVPWLDLVRADALKPKLAALVAEFERTGYRPEALQSLVSAEDARRRWGALAAFYKERGHFLVTNGPYRLKAWRTENVTLEAFRDLSYPLGVGSYDAYAIPRRGFVAKVEQEAGRLRIGGEIEVAQKFQRSYRIERQTLRAVASDVLRRSTPECRYMVQDAEGRVVLAGRMSMTEDFVFTLDLAARLPAGRYTVSAMITVVGNAMNAAIERIPVTVPTKP